MSMYECPSTERWEEFVTIAADAVELREHLQQCGRCRLLVQALRDELAAEAADWHRAGVIRCCALTDSEKEHGVSEALLAAQGERGDSLPRIAVLASPDRNLMIRAIREDQSGDIWFYLLSDDEARIRNVLVRPFGLDRDFITDEYGRFNAGALDWPVDDSLKAEVRLPQATFELKVFDPASDSAEVTSDDGDRIRFTWHKTNHGRQLRIDIIESRYFAGQSEPIVAVRAKGTTRVWGPRSTAQHRAEFNDVLTNEEIEVFLYSV